MDIFVVEGKNDYNKLREVIKDNPIIITGGMEISDKTLNLLKEYSKDNRIIIFTDPDSPGNKIRNKIKEVCDNTYDLFLKKDKCISKNKRKVGIEHADVKDIEEVINQITITTPNNNYWNLDKLIKLNLTMSSDSKDRREYLADKLNIGRPNTKTLINRLNDFNISYDKVKEILDSYEG